MNQRKPVNHFEPKILIFLLFSGILLMTVDFNLSATGRRSEVRQTPDEKSTGVTINPEQQPTKTINLGGMKIDPQQLPQGLILRNDLEIITVKSVEGKVLF